jgi:hypothetical protein
MDVPIWRKPITQGNSLKTNWDDHLKYQWLFLVTVDVPSVIFPAESDIPVSILWESFHFIGELAQSERTHISINSRDPLLLWEKVTGLPIRWLINRKYGHLFRNFLLTVVWPLRWPLGATLQFGPGFIWLNHLSENQNSFFVQRYSGATGTPRKSSGRFELNFSDGVIGGWLRVKSLLGEQREMETQSCCQKAYINESSCMKCHGNV